VAMHKKVSVAQVPECTHRGAMSATAHIMTSLLITNDKLNCWFDFFIIIPRWVKLVEPYKVRFDIDQYC